MQQQSKAKIKLIPNLSENLYCLYTARISTADKMHNACAYLAYNEYWHIYMHTTLKCRDAHGHTQRQTQTHTIQAKQAMTLG